MCDATAYLVTDGVEELLLESVDLVELDGEEATLTNIFGERKILKARLKLFDNGQGKLLFESLQERDPPGGSMDSKID